MILKWLVYLLRLGLSYGYGVLVFLSKPGSILIVPMTLAVMLYLTRDLSHAYLEGFIEGFTGKSWAERQADILTDGYSVSPTTMDFILIGLWCGFVLLYRLVLSPFIAIMIQTFPRLTKPLPPTRTIARANKAIASEVVRLAVPPLRR